MLNSFSPVDEPKAIATPIITVAPKSSKQKSLIFMMTITATAFSALSALASFSNTISINKMKSEVMQSYVVEPDGNRLAIHQITDPAEKAQHIQNFATWFVGGLYDYRWYIDGEKGEKIPDPGLPASGGRRIPTALYTATMAMRPQLAVPYRKSISQVISEKNISARESSYFKAAVGGASPPEPVGKNLWKIYVKGTQISVAESGEERLTDIYIVLTIGEIQPVSLSIAQKDYKDMAMAKAYAATSAAGLQVQSFKDLTAKALTIEPSTKPSTGAK